MVEIVVHDEAGDFIATAGAYLESRECEHNLPLGLVGKLAKDPAYYGQDQAYLVSIIAKGAPIGAALMTPPRRIILSRIEGRIDSALAPLVGYLDKVGAPMPGVVGPAEEARAFCTAWQGVRPEVEVCLDMELRVFEARQVAPIRLSSGALRAATAADSGLVAEWLFAFGEDIGESSDVQEARDSAAKGIAEGAFFLWDDGGPVSMAKWSRPTRHGITITAVYTPPDYRNRGYASSCVHGLTFRLLAKGYEFCSLFTDLANPTSNSIYTKIGYRPMGDSLAFGFSNE